jgi:hypothetical protein
MAHRNIFKKLSLVLLIILIGSFSFAEDKKVLPPKSANPQQQDCTEDNKKNPNPNPNITSPTPNPTPEKKGTNPESLPPSPFQFQDNKDDG